MTKAWSRLIVLAALATAAFLATSAFRGREPDVGLLDELQDTESTNKATAPPAVIEAPSTSVNSGTVPARVPTSDQPTDDGPALHGVVVDSATGHGIVGALIDASAAGAESGSASRPRRSVDAIGEPRISGPVRRTTSDSDGRFVIPWSADHRADLRIVAAGHLDEFRPSVSVDDALRIALRAGSPIRGRIHRGDGVGVEGARVRADAATRDANERGVRVASTARTDAGGAFEVLGLPGVSSTIVVTHADYMPASVRSTPESGPLTVAMVPALKTWLRVRTLDDRPVAPPVVQWNRTSAARGPLGVGVVDLAIEGRESNADRPESARRPNEGFGPVKVPCVPADGVVQFTVRVVGCLPWTSDELPVPAGGGERTLDVTLERDPGVGSITVRLRDPDGGELSFKSGDAAIVVRRTDGPALAPHGIERDGAVVFDGLLAGTYEVTATERRFGAATTSVNVEGGRSIQSDVRLSSPASLRVRADAGPKRRIHFQLLRAGVAITAFEDPPPKLTADPDKSLTRFFAGSDGTLLRGLGAGRLTVRVLSPDLVASDTDVELVAGSVVDVEIHAKPR